MTYRMCCVYWSVSNTVFLKLLASKNFFPRTQKQTSIPSLLGFNDQSKYDSTKIQFGEPMSLLLIIYRAQVRNYLQKHRLFQNSHTTTTTTKSCLLQLPHSYIGGRPLQLTFHPACTCSPSETPKIMQLWQSHSWWGWTLK